MAKLAVVFICSRFRWYCFVLFLLFLFWWLGGAAGSVVLLLLLLLLRLFVVVVVVVVEERATQTQAGFLPPIAQNTNKAQNMIPTPSTESIDMIPTRNTRRLV